MFILVAVTLSVAAAGYVAWPLFRRPDGRVGQAHMFDQLNDLLYQKKLAQDTIQDLDFDLQTGKLSMSDHEVLLNVQKLQIARVDTQLAQKASAKKNDHIKKLEHDIAAASGAAKPTLVKTCGKCGFHMDQQARFCSQCGAAIL